MAPIPAAHQTRTQAPALGRRSALAADIWLGVSVESAAYAWRADHLRQVPAAVRFLSVEPLIAPAGELDLSGIDWVIVGGESGPGARPMEADWAREVREQCLAAGVAFFFKQWGGVNKKATGRELDGRTWDQFPQPMDRSRDARQSARLPVSLQPVGERVA